jgi:hypothetical protein
MVQKTLIASRSFQPSAKRTVIFVRTARTRLNQTTRSNHATAPIQATTLIQMTTPIQSTTSARQRCIEISEFPENH